MSVVGWTAESVISIEVYGRFSLFSSFGGDRRPSGNVPRPAEDGSFPEMRTAISSIKGGSVLFIYANNKEYMAKSSI